MIDARELRIGNKVLYSVNSLNKIYGTITGLYNTIDELSKGIIDFHYPLTFGEPIPLTTEILEKCGFKTNYANSNLCFIDTKDWRIEIFENRSVWIGDAEIIDIKSLHQLQNLYYALTQKELEIKL